MKMEVGNDIRTIRRLRNLTQSQLGKEIGVRGDLISQWERLHEPVPFRHRAAIEEALQAPIDFNGGWVYPLEAAMIYAGYSVHRMAFELGVRSETVKAWMDEKAVPPSARRQWMEELLACVIDWGSKDDE